MPRGWQGRQVRGRPRGWASQHPQTGSGASWRWCGNPVAMVTAQQSGCHGRKGVSNRFGPGDISAFVYLLTVSGGKGFGSCLSLSQVSTCAG